jgi:hypothetical protein
VNLGIRGKADLEAKRAAAAKLPPFIRSAIFIVNVGEMGQIANVLMLVIFAEIEHVE